MSLFHNYTLYDIAPGCDAGHVTEAASSSFGPATVGAAAGVPTLFLVVSLFAHLYRVSESVRRLIDSVNQLIDRLRACFRWRNNVTAEADACPTDASIEPVQALPMRNLSDSQMAAIRSAPSASVWM